MPVPCTERQCNISGRKKELRTDIVDVSTHDMNPAPQLVLPSL
jgi:hypothetical protein